MDRKRIRKEAEERISYGFSRQHVYDELALQYPEVKPKKLAEVVRYIPSLAAREHYKQAQQALLYAVIATGVVSLLKPILSGEFNELALGKVIRFAPIATIFLGFSVYRWRGEVYQWLGFVNLMSSLGLLAGMSSIMSGEADPWSLINGGLALAICVLAFHLHRDLFPKYTEEKDPLGNMRPRIVFPPEPGMYRM